nr:hypothetical protein [Tanacetum cinerariifolium]
MNWRKVNPVHAYYNGSRTSKDNEDPSRSASFKTKRTQKTYSALEALWKTLFALYLIGTLKEHTDINPKNTAEQNQGMSKYFLFEDNELTLIEDYDDSHVYNKDTYGLTYVDPYCYYEEADAIIEVQVYPYDKDIRYLMEQIRGDIEELEKKKKKNDVM